MENQHRKITGYRELSQYEIDLMNRIKAKGEELGSLVEEVTKHLIDQRDASQLNSSSDEFNRIRRADPVSWAVKGELDLKVGIMALVRSVAQPTSF